MNELSRANNLQALLDLSERLAAVRSKCDAAGVTDHDDWIDRMSLEVTELLLFGSTST